MDAIATEAYGAIHSLFEAGGAVILLLLLFSIVVVAVVLMKLAQFAAVRLWSSRAVDAAIALHVAGRAREALALLARSRHPAALPVAVAIEGVDGGAGEALVRVEAGRLAAAALQALRSRLRILEVIGAVAPLVGLLGTVLGLISAFQALETAGAQVSPATLSGGIWEALVTTACGLAVAIPAVMLGSWLEGFVDRAHHATEDALTRVFTLRRTVPAAAEAKTAVVPLGAMRDAH
jgi:biopolymer transport protein ExbB